MLYIFPQVPVEAERLTGNDLVLEQYLSPVAPGLAGFRLDAFSAIKPRITHSPSPIDVDIWQSSLTNLEDRHISPAVLYLQVSVVQVFRKGTTILLPFIDILESSFPWPCTLKQISKWVLK